MSKICFITAIYGNYESTCKPFVKQTVDADFICFTDNPNMPSNGWIIDTNPYHLLYKSPIDNDMYINSICRNKHTFNIAKYYKQSFRRIPLLHKYDVIVWLDGTIQITHPQTAEYIMWLIPQHKIIGWEHEFQKNILENEVIGSHFDRYTSTYWNHQHQPYQDIDNQYKSYLQDGFKDVGVWVTCFIAFLHKDDAVKEFLDLWYLQTLTYTTQDQISFPYVCFKTNIIPYTLPDNQVQGKPHDKTTLYIKHQHGR